MDIQPDQKHDKLQSASIDDHLLTQMLRSSKFSSDSLEPAVCRLPDLLMVRKLIVIAEHAVSLQTLEIEK